jgi:hypothetical protein
MVRKLFASLITAKILIRVAVSILSLGGIAQAHAVGAHQSGAPYNFMAGGGG